MKPKSKVTSILMLSLLLSMIAFTFKPAYAQNAILKVQDLPPVPNYGPGKSFYFLIYVEGVTNLWSFDFTLTYNTTILTAMNYTISVVDPVGGNGFRNFFPTNEINDEIGYVRVGADRGPSGQITNEIVGTGDGSTTVFFLDNPRIEFGSAQIYVAGSLQPPSAYNLNLNTGRIIFTTAPGLGQQIKANYFHPGLTSELQFNIVTIGFNIDGRGVSPMDLQDTSLYDIDQNLMTYDVSNTVFDNRFQGHVAAPDYVNGTIMAGEEFDIEITVDHVTVETGAISFFLDYDTNVLTALTGFEINDTGGYVYVKLTDLSLTATDPIPLTTIRFLLDNNGWSPLNFRELTAVSIFGDALTFDATNGTVSTLHDVAVTDVTLSATKVAPGSNLPINVTIANQGNFTESFIVTAFYNSTAIAPSQTVPSLASGTNQTLIFNWDTTGVAQGNYTIKAVASTVTGESDTSDNTFIDGTAQLVLGPGMSINPTFGAVGTKVEATGVKFGSLEHITLSFDDTPIAEADTDNEGAFTATFNIPVSEAGAHFITAVSSSMVSKATFTVIDVSPMDVEVEAGQIHFRGESAEFYIQTAFKGEPIDSSTLTVTLQKPDGTSQTLTPIQHVATGLFKTTYSVPANAPVGTYVLVANAEYVTDTVDSKGTSIGSFLLSPTLTGWNAELIDINGNVATVKTDVGLIKLDLDAIDPTLTDIETNVTTILGKILTVQGDIATIKTDVGTIKTTINKWTGATISSVVTPTGTFNLLALTTSSSLDSLKLQGNTITVVVSGPAGTSGTTNVILPKQFLAGIGTSIGQIEATINDQKANIQHTEDPNIYVLSISYTPGANTIKIFLTGIPPTQPPIPITILLLIVIAIVVVAVVVTVYMRRRSKKPADQSTNP